MPRVLAFVAVLAFAALVAQPATAPYAGPTTTPADAPKTMVLAAVREMATAKNLSLTIETREQTTPIDKPQKADHDDFLNSLHESSQTLRMRRPDRLAFVSIVPPVDDGSTRFASTVVLDGKRLTVARGRDRAGRWQGDVIESNAITADRLLTEYRLPLAGDILGIRHLVSKDADTFIADNATDWTWLGGVRDSGGAAWRIGFKMPFASDEPADWEVWLSKTNPTRILRVITRTEYQHGFVEAKPGTTLPDDLSFDKSNSVMTSYRVRYVVETRFVACDPRTQPGDAAFVPPDGDFKPETFKERQIKLPVGAMTELTPLKTVNGKPVDFAERKGPVVLDFWFAACGPCRHATPKVEALIRRFEHKGVTLYGVNDIDSAAVARATIAADKWTSETLLDPEKVYKKQFDVDGYPTVIVIDPAGRILYRGSPNAAGAMVALEKVLKAAVGDVP